LIQISKDTGGKFITPKASNNWMRPPENQRRIAYAVPAAFYPTRKLSDSPFGKSG